MVYVDVKQEQGKFSLDIKINVRPEKFN